MNNTTENTENAALPVKALLEAIPGGGRRALDPHQPLLLLGRLTTWRWSAAAYKILDAQMQGQLRLGHRPRQILLKVIPAEIIQTCCTCLFAKISRLTPASSSSYTKSTTTKLLRSLYVEHGGELGFGGHQPVNVRTVHHKHNPVRIRIVALPVRPIGLMEHILSDHWVPDACLTSEIPHLEFDVLDGHRLHIKSNR